MIASSRRWGLGASIALAVLALAPAARSEPRASALAQVLFEEGVALMGEGHFAEACPKLAESQRLDPGGGTLLNLALCLELSGKTGSAWARYQEARAIAARDGRKDREEFAREHLALLGPKLRRVVVIVPAEVAALGPSVTLDDSRLGAETWGTPLTVDPGQHRISARAPGQAPWEAVVEVPEEGRTLRVEVGRAPSDGAHQNERSAATTTAFWLTLGAGSAALLAGGILGVVALGSSREADDGCAPTRSFCNSDAQASAARARTEAWASTGFVAAGALGVGVAFLFLRPAPARAPTARLEGFATDRGGGVRGFF